jgi:hypothetical protein
MKVCWLSWHMHTPQMFLDSIIKMTPGKSGKWKDMEAVTDPHKADFVFVMDGYNTPLPLERTIFFAEHPDCLTSFKSYEDKKGKALLCLPLNKFPNPGEWWLDYDYDYLSTLKSPNKTKQAICCFTAHSHKAVSKYPNMYTDRVKFMEKALLESDFAKIDLYGRPAQNFTANAILNRFYRGVLGVSKPDGGKGEHQHGKEILSEYRYSFEFDVGLTSNYWSERIYDSILLWCYPLYWGSRNLHEYLPKDSFAYVNIEAEGTELEAEVQKAMYILRSDTRERNLKAIEEARDLMLNRYQMWAYMHDVVHNIDKYKKEWYA